MEEDSIYIPETENHQPNWQKEAVETWWQPSRQLLKAIRSYQNWQKKGGLWGRLMGIVNVAEFRFWSVICGCDIPINVQIGGGLMLPHPTGVVIHPRAKIGVNCIIFQQVTITANVTIGNGVLLGAGAKILSGTTLGNHVRVGANAVVKRMTAPNNSTIVGIPGRIFPSQSDAPLSVSLDGD